SPTSSATYSTTVSNLNLSGSASDAASGLFNISWASDKGGSGTAIGTTNWSIANLFLQAGANVITVTAKDTAGNSSSDTITVNYAASLNITNPGFESGTTAPGTGWSWWSRDTTGTTEFSSDAQEGLRSLKIVYANTQDWALNNSSKQNVQKGQFWKATAWVKCQDTNSIYLEAIGLTAGKWMTRAVMAKDIAYGTKENWVQLSAVAQIPEGCDQIFIRFSGTGKAAAWLDNVSLQQITPEAKPQVQGWAQQRVEESLGRGVAAIFLGDGKVYIGWRLLEDDDKEIAFNIYRVSATGAPVKLNSELIDATTDFIDTTAPLDKDNTYFIRAVSGGQETKESERFTLKANSKANPYLSIKLNGSYLFNRVAIADLNGDGQYDFVIRQPDVSIDPHSDYWKASTDTYKIEAYLADGTFLWRND
ncbi:MAG: hypothetical protein AABZ27_00480, partial [Candidatus Omnitrophota bacterium]